MKYIILVLLLAILFIPRFTGALTFGVLPGQELKFKDPPKVKKVTTQSFQNIKTLIGDDRLIEIAYCESGLKQFKNGKPLISHTNDVGVMQINEVHFPRARALGLDIFYSTEDNIKMGKLILRDSGYRAWTCNKLV